MDRPSADRADNSAYNYWHNRLLAGDAEAAEWLATMLLRDLPRSLRFRPVARLSDSGVIGEAINEAIEHYLEHPALFKPALGRLIAYLARSAENRLKDRRAAEDRRHRRETEAAVVLGELGQGKGHEADDEPPDLIEFARPLCKPEELALLEAVIDRKSLAEKAATLGLRNGSREEQQTFVNRIRERLVTRLRRHARRLGFYLDRPRGSTRHRSKSDH